MTNSQQLFEINKRINQIKRNLQMRQEKAQEWSVPYQRILQKPLMNQTCQTYFRNTHSNKFETAQDQMRMTFNNKTQRKLFFQKKVKQSRKKINQFHNQLKELQQLLARKTKLHVKKQQSQQAYDYNLDQAGHEKQVHHLPIQSKTTGKVFSNSLLLTGIMGKPASAPKNSVRNLKDRTNPFFGLKVQKMIELYQQAKHSGKQNLVNQTLGMGIDFTPYSTLKKDLKKQDDLDAKVFGQNNSGLQLSQTNTNSANQDFLEANIRRTNNLSKVLETKVGAKKQIYLETHDQVKRNDFSPLKNKKKSNIFEHRMKNLLQETSNFEDCQGNYVDMLKKNRNKERTTYFKTPIGKIRANNTYKTVFQI